jgi:hypothetical protein
MVNSVLRIYIDRNAKANTRYWRGFGCKISLSRYLLEKAQELADIFAAILNGPKRNEGTFPIAWTFAGLLRAWGFSTSCTTGNWAGVGSFGSPLRSSRPLLAGCLTYRSQDLMRKNLRDVLMDSSNGGISDAPRYMQRHSSNE